MPIDSARAKRVAFVLLFFVIASLSFSITFFEIFSYVFILAALLAYTLENDRKSLRDSLFLLLGLYLLANIISLTGTRYWDVSLRGVATKVARQMLLCAGAIYVVDTRLRFRRLFEFILLVGLIISLDAILQWFLGFDPIRMAAMTPFTDQTKRLTATFHHANDFASFLCLLVPLYLTTAFEAARLYSAKNRVLFYTGLAFCLIALFGTFSRGAWIAVAGSVLLLLLLKPNRFLAGCFILVTVWMLFFSPATVRNRFTSLFSGSDTVKERTLLWRESYEMIRQKPLLGWGVNTYARNEPNFKSKEIYTDNQYTHNGYLQMAAEIGLAGLTVFLMTVCYLLIKSFLEYRSSGDDRMKLYGYGFVLSLTAFLIHGATDTSFHSILLINLFWVSAGITYAGARCVRQGKQAKPLAKEA